MDTMYKDVAIYASCDKDPVLRTSRLTLGGHSALLASLLRSLSVCDGCEASLAIIIADEDRDTVRAALGKVISGSGVTVIRGNVIGIHLHPFDFKCNTRPGVDKVKPKQGMV